MQEIAAQTKKTNQMLSGSEEALFLQHTPLVKAIVSSIWRGLPAHADFDDLLQAGSMGLLDAVRRFDPSKGAPFSVYAKFRIRGAVLDSLRNLDELGRADRKRIKLLQRELQADGDQTAAGPGSQPAAVTHSLRSSIPVGTGSTGHKDEGDELAYDPAAADHSPEQLYGHTMIQKLLARTVGELPSRYQQVIDLYYEGDRTMKEIGGILGVNESRVSQMHRSALTKMATVLADQGISFEQLGV
jgi:RNA polymerase sigma factor for flagellar operon FliA